jgi:spore germination protein KB
LNRITQLQVYMFFSQFLFSTTIGFFVSPLVKNASYMSWVSVLTGSALGLGIAYLAYRLGLRRPDRSLGQYGPEILGKWIHYPLFAFVIFINLFSAAYILRQLIDFIVQIYLPETPDWAAASLFGVCVARAVHSGPVTLFRSAQGLFFFSIASVITFPLFVIPEINKDMVIAMFTNADPPGIWNGTMIVMALFAEMAFIVYLFPYIIKTEKTMKSLVWATVTAVIVTLADLIPTILLFGPELTANLTYPTLELIRYIRAGAFLENLDPLLIVFWLYSMFLKISLFVMVATLGLTHSLGLKDFKPFAHKMAALMVGFSVYMFESTANLEEITNHSETTFLLFTSVVPLLYLLVDWLRSRRNKSLQQQP